MQRQVMELIQNMNKTMIGMDGAVLKVVLAMLSNGHVLIEDVPGVGKTRLALALAQSVSGQFQRIQMTPDIMPSDILGFTMIDKMSGEFQYHPGAAVCNFLLADEINRASAKAQSSLLEVMEERQISMDGSVYKLPDPFITFATQNPIENYGTYHLPEAQMDRFIMCISMGYPTPENEMKILENNRENRGVKDLEPVWTIGEVVKMQEKAELVRVSESVKKYIISLVNYTRTAEGVKLGLSPRGGIGLFKVAKALAFIQDRDYVTPNDVALIAGDVISHRIILSQKGKTQYGDARSFVKYMLKHVPVE